MRRKRPYTEPDRIKERIRAISETDANYRLIVDNKDMPVAVIMSSNSVSPEFKVAAYKWHEANNSKRWWQ